MSLIDFVTLNHLALLGLTHFICKMEIKVILHLTIVSKILEITKKKYNRELLCSKCILQSLAQSDKYVFIASRESNGEDCILLPFLYCPFKIPFAQTHAFCTFLALFLCLSKNVFSIKSSFLLPLVYPLESKSCW